MDIKTKKKGIIITRANYPIGSWSNRVRMLSKGMIANGIDIQVLVTTPWPTEKNIKSSESFVKFLSKPSKKKESLLSIFSQLYTLRKVYNEVKGQNEIDFILLTGDRFLDAYVINSICKKKDIKLNVDIVDEVGRQFDSNKQNIYNKLAIINRRGFNYLLNNFNKIFVLSSYLENKYKLVLKEKSKVIRSSPAFIDENDFYQKSTNNSIFEKFNFHLLNSNITITYAGSCLRPNGLFFFIDVLKEILKQNKYSINLVLIFHVGNVASVKEYLLSKGLVNNVHILEDISPRYIPSLYLASDILVLPEQGDVIANAGFPGKVGEYLISGKAIITTDFSDLKDYLIDGVNCYMSKIGDFQSYKEKLISLLENKQIRDSLGKEAKKTGRSYFDYKNAVKTYLE